MNNSIEYWQTTKVNIKALKFHFINFRPRNYNEAANMGFNEMHLRIALRLDAFDELLRHYIYSGDQRSKRTVLKIAKDFINEFGKVYQACLTNSIEIAGEIILKHEFYEMIPNLKIINKEVKAILKNSNKIKI